MRRIAVLGLVLLGCGCVAATVKTPTASVSGLVFLTRGECVYTPTMRSNLDAALKALGVPADYPIVDLDTLPANDAKRSYPTPTLLYNDSDTFGMPALQPPYPEPT